MLAGAGLCALALAPAAPRRARPRGCAASGCSPRSRCWPRSRRCSISWSLTPATRGWRPTARSPTSPCSRAALALGRLAAQALERAARRRSRSARSLLCGWALLTKIFPGALAPDESFARLRPPFEYWNSVGLAAALGIPPMLWLAARRSGHAAVNALAWPALGLADRLPDARLLARRAAGRRDRAGAVARRRPAAAARRWRRSAACSSRPCRSSPGRSRRTG